MTTTAFRESSGTDMLKRITLSIISAALALTVAACGSQLSLKQNPDGSLTDKSNGTVYICAPLYYQPALTGVEPCAEVDDFEYFAIGELDSALWLTDTFGTVYTAEGKAELPENFADFEADKLFICIEETITTQIAEVTEAAEVAAVIDACVSGEKVTKSSDDKRYQLKFASSKYPDIYLALEYYVSADGDNYVYDRYGSGEARSLGGLLFKYLPLG